jgi:hypothetical protein
MPSGCNEGLLDRDYPARLLAVFVFVNALNYADG